MHDFDLCVIGSGPAGQRAAIQAAKLGKKVCIVERREVLGGVAINTGTIPSKALREAVLTLSGHRFSALNRTSTAAPKDAKIEDLIFWCQQVISSEIEVVRSQLARNDVQTITGTASFEGPNTVSVVHGSQVRSISATNFLIGTGTTPARPENIPFDSTKIVDADGILFLPKIPRTLLVVGGGVIGTEYASMLQTMGCKVTLIEGRSRLLEFLDPEIGEALQYHLRQSGMTLRLGEKVTSVEVIDAPPGSRADDGTLVQATLESDKTLKADCLLFCIGRQGATSELGLSKVNLEADNRGRIKVNEHYQTAIPNIYAAGDVIGFPALASTSMEQGRIAACHMFGAHSESMPHLFPYGIYSIPEISMVGWTEDKLTDDDIPFETGIAHYREISRGQLLGDQIGMLKILVHQETRAILGVHAIGTGATEIIHIGQAVMAHNGTADYFVNTVFNYPTLAECYKVAAMNAVNKLTHV
jgi:NAD(P) transhydrogenase